MCTPRKATVVAITLPCIAVAKNFHLFFTRGRQVTVSDSGEEAVNNCGFPTPAIEFFELYIRTWLGFILYAFIPIISVFILNVLIVKELWKVRKVGVAVGPTAGAGTGDASNKGGAVSKREERARKSNNQLTAMFLSVSITFLILIVPSITVLVINPYVANKGQTFFYVESVVDCMACLMHSSNFFLYCLTGAGFRRELKLMVGKWFGKTYAEELTVTEGTAA